MNLIPQFGSSSIGFDDMSVATSVGTSNSVTILINGPVSMQVLNDAVNPDTDKRDTEYQVLDDESQPALNSMYLAESFSTTSWSCTTLSGVSDTTPPGTGSNDCNDSAVTNIDNSGDTPIAGTFTDHWSFESSAYGPAGCGYEGISDYWQWCATGDQSAWTVKDPTTAISFAHLYGYSHTDHVSINGSVLPGGTNLVGTVITPSSNP